MQVRAGGWGKKEKARVERREAKGRKTRAVVSFVIQLDSVSEASRCVYVPALALGW
jgi:hypothetical protein